MKDEFIENTQPFKTLPNITPDFGNDWMSNAHEVALPEAINYMPQSSIVFWFLFLMVMVTSCALWGWYRSRQSTLYCRQAQAELNLIEERLNDGHHRELARIPGLLKQVAFSRWPRADLIDLKTDDWFQFWCASSPTTPPSFIVDIAYWKNSDVEAIENSQQEALLTWGRIWIDSHLNYVECSVAQLTGTAESSTLDEVVL